MVQAFGGLHFRGAGIRCDVMYQPRYGGNMYTVGSTVGTEYGVVT